MASAKYLLPFKDWENISKCIPETYYISQEQSVDYSWFTTAPEYSTFRVNILKHEPQKVLDKFNHLAYTENEIESPITYIHSSLPECIVIGPKKIAWKIECNEALGEVIVDVPCAKAVLRGADVFAPGIVGLYASAKEGDKVNIFADVDNKCKKGCTKKFEGNKFYVGHGILKMDRDALFKNNAHPKGIGVEVSENLTRIPRIDLPKDYGILQNLPSIICGHLFSEISGQVLDMCAAPGNKTTHIAALLGNNGYVTALDKISNKVSKLAGLCAMLGLSNVNCFTYDSTQCIQKDSKELSLVPPFSRSAFNAVLLDPPCSGLGQRPALNNPVTLKQLKSFPPLQRKLFKAAVEALGEGGILVYSTCTITLEENEDMVAWALNEYPELILQEIPFPLGKPGVKTDVLLEEQRLLVKRFGSLQYTSPDEDTIGFFIAKFLKINK